MSRFNSFLAAYFDNYIEYCRRWGPDPRRARYALTRLDRYLVERRVKDGALDASFFLEFRAALNLEAATRNSLVCSLRGFFDSLVRKELCDSNPLRDIPLEKRNEIVPFVFSAAEVEALLAAVCTRMRTSHRYYLPDLSRYLAILFLARCGLRISEALKLKLIHYRKEERTIYIEQTKFNKSRLIPIAEDLDRALNNYLSVRSACPAPTEHTDLLIGYGQKRLSRAGVRKVFHRAVQDLGLARAKKTIGSTTFLVPTPHSLRHSFAVNTLNQALERGRSPENVLPVLAAYLGHTHYQYTVTYLKVLDAAQHRRLRRFCKRREER